MDNFIVLIPAYCPDEKLINLIDKLNERKIKSIVVDDGSGTDYKKIFDEVKARGIHTISYETNKGKGHALKTGIRYIQENFDVKGIVTADADGQHTPDDITKVIEAMKANDDTFVIGARAFKGNVPFRSRFGNGLTKWIFRLATHLDITDTQTGLRGLPAKYFKELVEIDGSRYEYEMNMLLAIKTLNAKYMEIPIETVYLEGNKSSHFHVIRDSFFIYKRIFKFVAASFISFLIDYAAFVLLGFLNLPSIILPFGIIASLQYIIARLISGTFNYLANRKLVFKNGNKTSAIKYFILCIVIMAVGSMLISVVESIGINRYIAKPIIDFILFFVNFYIQKHFVFKPCK